jgi:hypothetical protein
MNSDGLDKAMHRAGHNDFAFQRVLCLTAWSLIFYAHGCRSIRLLCRSSWLRLSSQSLMNDHWEIRTVEAHSPGPGPESAVSVDRFDPFVKVGLFA